MSIEVALEGHLEDEQDFEGYLRMVSQLAEQWQLKMEMMESYAIIDVCPEGMIQLSYEDGYLTIAAQTNVAGPGFHAYVCDFFHAIVERSPLPLTVEDPTNYYTHHQFDRLVKEVFHRWLREIGNYIRETKNQEDRDQICLSWPVDYYVPQPKKGCVVTPMGYIRIDDFLDQDLDTLAEQFFVWNHLSRDSAYYRNAALNLLWKECYFEYSNMNEMTEKQADTILDYLEIAHRLDPHLALPMKEYVQLCEIRQREKRIHDAAELHFAQPIGYRRELVHVRFGHWSVPVSGYAQESVEENTQTLYLIAPYRCMEEPWQWLVQINVYAFQHEVKGFLKEWEEAEQPIDISHDQIVGRAFLQREADHIRLYAQCNCGKEMLKLQWIICEEAMVDTIMEQVKQIRAYPIKNDEFQA